MKKLITLLLVLTGMVCSASADTYTVAGTEGFFGSSWKESDENNDMSETESGVWTLSRKVTLSADESVAFKVVKNHNWRNAYPGSNYSLGTLKAGTYYFQITINTNEDNTVTHVLNCLSIQKVELRGSFSWWSSGPELTLTSGSYAGSVDLTNSIADQKFKIVITDNNGGEHWVGNGSGTIINEPSTGWITGEPSGDMNYILNNTITGYKAYQFSAQWDTERTSLDNGWTLAVEGSTARPATTYTVTVLNDASWSNVYAHAWNKVNDEDVVVTGAWPGVRMTTSSQKNINGTDYDVYTFTMESMPEKILFNIGSNASQTRDLKFIDGKEYYTEVNYLIAGHSDVLDTWWDTANYDNLMERTYDGNYALVKSNKTLTKGGEYTYKVLTTESWSDPNYGKGDEYDNATLDITEDGIYNVTFVLNASTHVPTASGDMLSCKATINPEIGYATFSSASHDLDFSDVTELDAYRATTASNGNVHMEAVTGKVPANTGLFLAGETGYIPVTTGATSIGDNLLKPTTGSNIYDNSDSKYQYVFAIQDDVTGFYKVGGALSPAAGKAYLETIGSAAQEARLAFVFDDGETTGIGTVVKDCETENNEYYNLAGQRVAQPTKGLYLVNGKKVFVK